MKDISKNKNNEIKMYFSDAMDKINESIDYNEHSEVNTSEYFKNSLYKAEDEIDKMVSSPLMTNYKKYKDKKLSLSPKRRKNLIFKRIQWLKERNQNKESEKKIKINSDSKKEKIHEINKSNIKDIFKDKIENQKFHLISKNLPPLINISSKTIEVNSNNKINNSQKIELHFIKNFDEKENYLTEPNNVSHSINNSINRKLNKDYYNHILSEKKKKVLFEKRNKDLPNLERITLKDFNTSRQTLDSIYLKSIQELETLRLFKEKESERFERIKNENKKDKSLKNNMLINKNRDKIMKIFLSENIKELSKDKNNREQKIMKDYVDMKLKKDPIIRLSEKFAYANRKPLLNLFHYDEEKKKIKDGPLAKLKVKDKKIMKKLDDDNRNTKLLMKRLEEDQQKYTTGGYFFMAKDQDSVNNKKNNFRLVLDSDTHYQIDKGFISGFNFTNLKGFDPNEI